MLWKTAVEVAFSIMLSVCVRVDTSTLVVGDCNLRSVLLQSFYAQCFCVTTALMH